MTIDRYDTGKLRSDVARRLLAIREAYALDQQQFGVRAGLSQPQYNQYETGSRTLTLKSAIKLCDTYGLTLDYLYRGDPSGLPYRLAEAIRTGSRLSTGSAEN